MFKYLWDLCENLIMFDFIFMYNYKISTFACN